jgi:hypothetical protein
MTYKDCVSIYTTSTSWPLIVIGASTGNRDFASSYGADVSGLPLVLREVVGAQRWMTFTGSYSFENNTISLTSFRNSSSGSLITPDGGSWLVSVELLSDDINTTNNNISNNTSNISAINSKLTLMNLTLASLG